MCLFKNIVLFVFISISIKSQIIEQNHIMSNETNNQFEKCNFDPKHSSDQLKILGDGWGYNYDSLMLDLDKWNESPYVEVDSFGATVQNRALWELKISDYIPSFNNRTRITIHARTHPGEIHSFYATREIINILLGNSELAQRFRKHTFFNIIPMYNPDGVELGYGRENANGVDLEREWDKENPQPEAAALKSLYLKYMNSGYPIKIALNMHNDGGAELRYFVYHHENGTSVDYTIIEQEFISVVRSYWPEGIVNWDAVVTWTEGTPTHYPESWFWLNYQESVLALTFEEVTTGSQEDFVKTAEALLKGIADVIELEDLTSIEDRDSFPPRKFQLNPNFPNPFNPSTKIVYSIPSNNVYVKLSVYNILGQEVAVLVNNIENAGLYEVFFDASGLTSGTYFYRIRAGGFVETKKMLLMK